MKVCNPETAYDVFIYNSSIIKLFMPVGARLTLLKYSVGNDLFASQMIIQQLHRIKLDQHSIARERRGFESWRKYMQHIPKKPVEIVVNTAINGTLDELHEMMYPCNDQKRDSIKALKVKKQFASYLVAFGMLRYSCNINESEVSK